MSKTIARSEITIVDLIDTATYIYYAKDDQGTGATSTPTSDTKYIGISYVIGSMIVRPHTNASYIVKITIPNTLPVVKYCHGTSY